MKTLTITKGISEDGDTLFMTDATDLVTAYGVTVPARNTLALVPYILYKNSDGSQVVIVPEAYSPLNVVTFSIDVDGKDGVYYFQVFALPRWTSGVLATGSFFWNLNTSAICRYDAGDVITPVDVSLLVGSTLDYGEANANIDVQLSIYRSQLEIIMLAKLEAMITQSCELQDYIAAQMNYNYVRSLRSVAHINFCMGNYLEAQQKIETGIAFAEKALNIT